MSSSSPAAYCYTLYRASGYSQIVRRLAAPCAPPGLRRGSRRRTFSTLRISSVSWIDGLEWKFLDEEGTSKSEVLDRQISSLQQFKTFGTHLYTNLFPSTQYRWVLILFWVIRIIILLYLILSYLQDVLYTSFLQSVTPQLMVLAEEKQRIYEAKTNIAETFARYKFWP